MKRDFYNHHKVSYKNTKEVFAFLQKAKTLDVELGCGVGFHALSYSEKNKDHSLVAIEKTKEKFQKFSSRVEHHSERENLLPVHANALSWVPYFLKKDTVDTYFLLYPNPYPKKKRWHNTCFMSCLLDTLKPKGQIILATNSEEYVNEACDIYESEWHLTIKEKKLLERAFSPRTHFEKKYLQRNEPCYNVIFEKS